MVQYSARIQSETVQGHRCAYPCTTWKNDTRHTQRSILPVSSTDSERVVAKTKQHTGSKNEGLCSRSGPNYWMNCRAAIIERLGVRNVTCAQKCVTFPAYGRFNNNIIQLVNAYTRYADVHRIDAANRHSIVLSGFFKSKMHGNVDFKELEKTCIFPSWSVEGRTQHRTNCMQLDARKLFDADRSKNQTSQTRDDRRLLKAWLLYGTVIENAQRQITEYAAQFQSNFSAVHARFLEGECARRHETKGMSSNICQFKPHYIALMLAKLGHTSHSLVFCSDKQQQTLVAKVVTQTHGVLSKHSNPLMDVLLMVLSKRFLGNAVSSMSLNVKEVREAIFENDAINALV